MALTVDEPLAELQAERERREREAPTRQRKRSGITLAGAVADRYIDTLVEAIRQARLNAIFPPERALITHLCMLAPKSCEGLYPELELSRASGLPSARDIMRVKIDRDLTSDFLASAAERPPPSMASRQARRIAYYTRLSRCETMPLSRMSVELRQQLPDENLAQFRVRYDRFDIASARFARYTILLSQRDRFWRQRHVIVDDADLAAPTESFRRIVRRFTADEAELAFVLLSKVPGIEVEDVRRARIGPLYMPGVEVGAAIERLLDRDATPEYGDAPRFILCFPEDRAGLDVTEHTSGDPLAPLYREAVSAEARALIDAKADELSYRVSKTRKFVCSATLREPLAALCRELGAPSIVRSIRPGRIRAS